MVIAQRGSYRFAYRERKRNVAAEKSKLVERAVELIRSVDPHYTGPVYILRQSQVHGHVGY